MPQLNGASQVRYFSSSARKDVGQWIKVMVTIINNKVMVGKRWGCILSERERERDIASNRNENEDGGNDMVFISYQTF